MLLGDDIDLPEQGISCVLRPLRIGLSPERLYKFVRVLVGLHGEHLRRKTGSPKERDGATSGLDAGVIRVITQHSYRGGREGPL